MLAALPAAAQLPSNATLSGNYYFRYTGVDTTTSVNKPLSAIGTLVFDGNGHYTVTGTKLNSNGAGVNTSANLNGSGTYQVLSSGLFNIQSPFVSGIFVFGGVGVGKVIVGSSTDSAFIDLFVAFPASTAASNATPSGTYNAASMEFLNGDINSSRDTFFPITPDGQGSLGSVSVKGTAVNLQNAATTQTSVGASYTVNADGSGTITFPAPAGVAANSVLLSGSKTLYVSADGNLLMGGSAAGYDMFLAIRALGGSGNFSPLSGLYYTCLLNNDASGGGLYSSNGSANEAGQGLEFAHERSNYPGYLGFDSTYSDNFPFNSDGTVLFNFSQYAAGGGGNFALGAGRSTNYLLNFYVKVPAYSGTGVFLNPIGVLNAANYIPFTAQVSPGEAITLYGTGLYSGPDTRATSLPFQTILGGVQVNASWTSSGQTTTVPMPVFQVSANSGVSVIMPFNAPTDGSFVTFQVINNQTPSNSVQLYSGLTQPGVFALTQNGIGNGAILHADYSVVTPTNPAKVGEIVQIFLTGLGTVTPAVAAGAPASSDPAKFNLVDNAVDVYIDGKHVTPGYQGMAPGLALYQLNVTIPSGVTAGTNVTLEILTVDADNTLGVTIPIAK